MEWVDLLTNSGIAVACLAYFMWYNNTTMVKVTEQLNHMNENIAILLEKLDGRE